MGFSRPIAYRSIKKGHVSFRPTTVDGKSCQARLKKLLAKHRIFNPESQKKSGTSEEETELHILLDDLEADIRDFEEESKKKKSEKAKEEKGKQVCYISATEIQTYNNFTS